MLQTSEDILADVRKILGEEIRITKRNWAVYWCPSHPDESQKGSTGEPNFGVDLNTGRYNCFRCGFKGGSLKSLAKAVGAEYAPKNVEFIKRRPKRDLNNGCDVSHVAEAIADAQSRLLKSPAMSYLKQRGVKPYTAMMYGLGHAVGGPYISRDTAKAGYELGLITRGGTWLWQESIVYADPVSKPKVLNVRYLPAEFLKQPRNFQLGKHPHRTWGDRVAPLGAWRITARTRGVVIVEGLFDMLVGAQCLDERRLYPEYVCVYTNGASPSFEILDWFAEHDYDYFLIRDMDKAGADWVEMITTVLREKKRRYTVLFPPNGLDPDEAFLSGWWPPIIS